MENRMWGPIRTGVGLMIWALMLAVLLGQAEMRREKTFRDGVGRLRFESSRIPVTLRTVTGTRIRLVVVSRVQVREVEDIVYCQPPVAGRLQLWTRNDAPAGNALRIEVEVPRSVQVTLLAGSGAVEFHGSAGGLQVETDTGPLTCFLPLEADVNLSVRALAGRLSNQLPIELFSSGTKYRSAADYRLESYLDGRLGRGGTPVVLRSRSGAVGVQAEEPLTAAPTGGNTPPVIKETGNGTTADQSDNYFKVKTSLVKLNVKVRDARRQPLSGLTQSDFRVFEDGREQAIQHFVTPKDLCSFFLLLDINSTDKEKIWMINRARPNLSAGSNQPTEWR